MTEKTDTFISSSDDSEDEVVAELGSLDDTSDNNDEA